MEVLIGMNTTYDEIYQFFINNISVDQLSLPNTVESQYELIRNGIAHFNNRMQDVLSGDDQLESVSRLLTSNEMLVLVHIIKLILTNNILMYKSSVLIGFTKEIGAKNVGDQLSALRILVANEENEIEMIIFRADNSSIME